MSVTVIMVIFCLAGPAKAGINDYLACWYFNETAGQIAPDCGDYGFDGRLHGPEWSKGILGNALDFDGVDDYVEITDGNGYPDEIGALSAGTISLWFRFDSPALGDTIHPIFYLGDGTGGSGNSSLIIEIGHFKSGNQKLYFTILTDNKKIPLCFDSGFNLQLNTWYHFAAVAGPNFNTGYLDGQELTERHYNFGDASDSYFFDDITDKRVCWVGRGFLGATPATNYYDGSIDEIRIYDRPLSAGEIRQYYEGQLTTHSKILDDTPKTLVVNGYSTSNLWPAILQQRLDDYFGGQRVIEVVEAIKGGTPIAKWIDVETGQRKGPWLDILQPELQRAGPVIALAQQSLQWVFDPNDRKEGIRDEFDTERIEQGADAIETYVNALLEDGADLVLFATHIYKYTMEPEIHNEIYALDEALSRCIFLLERGPDVWTPTEQAWPEAFAADLVHPNEQGAELMATHWFETILARDAPWDMDNNQTTNLTDFAIFSDYWFGKNCELSNWCGNADFDRDGEVGFDELLKVSQHWLERPAHQNSCCQF